MDNGKTPEKTSATEELVIYTDGACLGNPGPGGWAAVLVRPGGVTEIGGREESTTNNRMELRAAIEGLRRAEPGERVRVVTDSVYLLKGISDWIHGWKRRGWRRAQGGPVLNRDLWEELDRLAHGGALKVAWEHVPGHSGHPFNERCDALATAFARGETPELRSGDGSWIARAEAVDPLGALEFPVYVSVVNGVLYLDDTWAECEARVKGVKGARYRKARTPEELRRAVNEWLGRPAESR